MPRPSGAGATRHPRLSRGMRSSGLFDLRIPGMNLNDTTLCSSGVGASPGRYFVAGCAQRAAPFAQPRPTSTNDDQRVRPAGHENIEDLGKGEKLAAYLVHVVATL